MALSSHGATFTFMGTQYVVTSVVIDSAQAEVVDMTRYDERLDRKYMVPTGAYTTPGRISIEGFGFQNPNNLVGLVGQASFQTRAGTISQNCVVESGSVEGKVNDCFRVRFSLIPTDYGT